MTGKSLFLRTRPASEAEQESAHDVQFISRLTAVTLLLPILCDVIGLRASAVVRGSEATGTVCAVEDRIGLGLVAGSRLNLESAAASPRLDDRSLTAERIDSYVAVPINSSSGARFGYLCAFDQTDFPHGALNTLKTMEKFARLIEVHLGDARQREQDALKRQHERDEGNFREQFMAILGHDLRNPLHAILANSEWLERKASEPAQRQVAARIQATARRMSTLIDDLLDFARVRMGGGIGVNITNVPDAGRALSDVVAEMQASVPKRQIVGNISVTRDIRCDIGRLQQVVSNLIGNALTHGFPTSPVRVSAHTNQDYFVLEVWNDCDPIPAASIDKVFQPFWRLNASGDRGGLGLGLHICCQIVGAHGGQMSVSSTRENGTQFTVRLPLDGVAAVNAS